MVEAISREFGLVKPVLRPGSRSSVRSKVDLIGQFMVKVQWDQGASQEEDAACLRAIAALATSAAEDLDPR